MILAAAAATAGLGWFVWTYYAAGIVLGLACILGGFTKFVWPMFKRIRNFLDNWEGEPARPNDGFEGRAGVMKRLSTIEFDVSSMKKELHPNHGTSMKDQLNELVKRSNDAGK